MKNLIFVFSLLTSLAFSHSAQAQQMELPFKADDQILLEAFPGSKNVRLVNNVSSLPSKIVQAFKEIDLPFEMGDGYYDAVAWATYEVTNDSGRVVGYIEAALMTYTEDPGYYLGMAFVNSKGRRLEVDPHMGSYEVEDLPSELHPEPENE